MVKITSKLYRPADLVKVIDAVENVLIDIDQKHMISMCDAKDIVIAIRKKGYKIVKVDDAEKS